MSADECTENKITKKPKKGIIYLATIPPFYNVTRIREIFGEYGEIGRVYLALADKEIKQGQVKKSKKKKIPRKFHEGWVEFERKSVAKKVAALLNNKQVDTRKKSKQYDCIWNIKYLSKFKWIHLHERLAYEKAARRQKLRAEIELAKKKSNYFSVNLDKQKKKKTYVNKEYTDIKMKAETTENQNSSDRTEFLKSLFNKN